MKRAARFLLVVCLVLLLAFPSLSVRAAADGLRLWFGTVLPTLLPFLICTQAIAAQNGMRLLLCPLYPAIHRFFGFGICGAYTLVCGLICGYPLGARLCAGFLRQGKLDRDEAQVLLAISNHPSPMFLLGYVAGQLPLSYPPAFLLAGLYLPVLPLFWAASRLYGYQGSRAKTDSAGEAQGASLEEIIFSSCETMVLIGGYIMLFSILAAWVGCLSFLPPDWRAAAAAAAEITTGIPLLCRLLPQRLAVIPVLAAAAFGGISGLFQTRGVLLSPCENEKPMKNAGLSIRHYLGWKAAHACLSGGITALLLALAPPLSH